MGTALYIYYVHAFGFESLAEDPLSILAGYFPPYIVLLFAMIIGPISEEVIFRIWVTGKQWAYWLTSIFIVTIGFTSTELHWVTYFGIGLLLYLIFGKLFSKFTTKNVVFFVVTSLSFAILHLTPTDSGFFMAIKIVYYLGVGGILAFVGVNYGFLSNVLSHMAFNAILIFIALFGGGPDDFQIKLNDGSQITLKALPVFSKSSHNESILKKDTLYIEGSIGEIMIQLSGKPPHMIMEDQTHKIFRYALSASSQNEINFNTLQDLLIERINFILDTTEIDAHCLSFANQIAGIEKSDIKQPALSINGLAYSIRLNQKFPVVVCGSNEGTERLIPVEADFFTLKSKTDLQDYLQKKGVILHSELDTTGLAPY